MNQENKFKSSYGKKILLLLFFDVIFILLSFYVGLMIRFDFIYSSIPEKYLMAARHFAPVAVFSCVLVYYFTRLYHSVWRYASVTEGYRIVVAYIVIAIVLVLENLYFKIPRSCLLIAYIFSFLGCVALRFGYRFLRYINHGKRRSISDDETYENVLLIGAGQAAREIIKDIELGGHKTFNVVGIIDDNKLKWGRDLEGIRILGGRHEIPRIVEENNVDRIIFAITNIENKDKKDILNICKDTKCHLQMVPSLYRLYSGQMTVSHLKDVDVLDLLGREQIKVDNQEIFNFLTGKVVMVTGAGGSIGSELSRQIARTNPKMLILFDIYENSVYDIQMELERHHPELNLLTLIGSIDDRKRVRDILTAYKPDVIYNAAAHKHVPLMEVSPNEAIKNNVIGTLILTEEAVDAGVGRFLQISTDKAVNPTNIMGASKRLCEMIVQMMARENPDTIFSAVRFGNVLGSNGSVIPLFKKQIKEGGPVTVTDKNIIRYFMTIPEAVSLVLQSSYYARGGEIFILDMGEPVRIDDMARTLIKLSGYTPDEDIDIVYTGLRPGEKLYEELLMDEEGMTKTDNDLIYVGKPIKMNDTEFKTQLHMLDEVSSNNVDNINEVVASVVKTYKPKKA